MTTTLKRCVQATADAAYVAHGDDALGAKLALGTPGAAITVEGTRVATGSGWGAGKTFEALAEGIELWLSALGNPAAITVKLNELIAAYAQLKADYNAAVVPTTAPDVEPL